MSGPADFQVPVFGLQPSTFNLRLLTSSSPLAPDSENPLSVFLHHFPPNREKAG